MVASLHASIETGIANGVSSSYFLLALRKNGKGKLHSIDLADSTLLPKDKGPGWFVFIHDSLHTYEHMIWEYREAYPYLQPGGLLFSDGALWNNAFTGFSREIHASQCRILHGVGFLGKD